ncbi:MAG: hypothetical protein SNJ64_03120 [Endomicrobiia bacterium]
MKKYLFYLIVLITATFIASCSSSDKERDEDVTPQYVVNNDSTGLTGKLTVVLYYVEGGRNYSAIGSEVSLYATLQDMRDDRYIPNTDLAIYRANTQKSNSVYFGYLPYGTYYIYSSINVNGYQYEKESVAEVFAQRENVRNVQMERKIN